MDILSGFFLHARSVKFLTLFLLKFLLLMKRLLIPLVSSVLFISGCTVVNNQPADRDAIEEVVVRYINALDTRDEDLYVSVFTEDAIYDIEGDVKTGHAELRAIITGLKQSREATIAAGRPPLDLYHSVLNSSIRFITADEAIHESYWQTLRRTDENFMRIGGMGRLYDELIKTDGEWRIKKRVLTNFVERDF
jgi:hypothetical protein